MKNIQAFGLQIRKSWDQHLIQKAKEKLRNKSSNFLKKDMFSPSLATEYGTHLRNDLENGKYKKS